MILLEGVSKTYTGRSRAALREVELSVPPGQFVYLTGPSGAGKTTLLRLLFAADFPTEGRVLVGGMDLGRLGPRHLPRLRRRVGVVFQDFRLLGRQSVFDNVALALRVAGRPPREVAERVGDILTRVDLTAQTDQEADSLSGGEQQRVAIARALVGRPPLILADEPTGNLDPANSRRVMALLLQAHAAGSTVVVATHDPSLPGMVRGARLVRLAAGRLEEMP